MYHPISECWLFHHAPHQGFTFFFLHFILFLLSLCFLLYLCLTSLLLVLLLVFIFLLALINFFSSILLTSAFLSFLLHPLLFLFLHLKPCSHNSIGTYREYTYLLTYSALIGELSPQCWCTTNQFISRITVLTGKAIKNDHQLFPHNSQNTVVMVESAAPMIGEFVCVV